MNSAASSSSSRSMPPSWSGVYTNTSWIPLASAVTCTGTEMVHDEAGLAVERGIEVGHHPHPPASALADPTSSSGGVDSSLPGQNGHGRSA